MADSEKDPDADKEKQNVIEIVPLTTTEGDEMDRNIADYDSAKKCQDESVSPKENSDILNEADKCNETDRGNIDQGMSGEVHEECERYDIQFHKKLDRTHIPTMDDFEGNDGLQIFTEGEVSYPDNASKYDTSKDDMNCERTSNDVQVSDKDKLLMSTELSDVKDKEFTDQQKGKPDSCTSNDDDPESKGKDKQFTDQKKGKRDSCTSNDDDPLPKGKDKELTDQKKANPVLCTSNDDDPEAKTNTCKEMDVSYSEFAKHVDCTSAPKLVNYSLESPDISLDEGIMFRRDENQDSLEEDSELNLELELSKESEMDVKPKTEWDSIINPNFVRKKLTSYDDTHIPDNRPTLTIQGIRRSIDDIGINDRRNVNKPMILTRQELAYGLEGKGLNVQTQNFQPKMDEQSDAPNILDNPIDSNLDESLYGQVDDNSSFASNAFSPEHVIGTAIKTEFSGSVKEEPKEDSFLECTSTNATHELHSNDKSCAEEVDVQCTPNDGNDTMAITGENEGGKEIGDSGDKLNKDSINDFNQSERVPRGRNRTSKIINAARKRRDTCSVPKPVNRKKLPKPRPLKASTKKRILRTFKKLSKAEADDDWMKDLSDKQLASMEESDLQEAIKMSVNDYVSKHGTMLNQTCFTAYHIPELQDLQDAMLTNNEFDTQVLTTKLLSLNRRVQSVPGDGNCLFSSVADQLRNHPTKPIDVTQADVRRLVIDHLRDNKEELELVLIDYLNDYGLKYDQYVEYMSRDRVWGDLVCHFVLARVLNIPYTIVLPYDNIEFNPDKVNEEDQFQHEITVVYNGFNHYSSSRKYLWDNYIRDKIRLANIDDNKKLDVNFDELMSKNTEMKLLYDTVIKTGLSKLRDFSYFVRLRDFQNHKLKLKKDLINLMQERCYHTTSKIKGLCLECRVTYDKTNTIEKLSDKLEQLKSTPPDSKEEEAMKRITEEQDTKRSSPSPAKNDTSHADAFDEQVYCNISTQGNVDVIDCTSNNSNAGKTSKLNNDVGSKNKSTVNCTPKKEKEISKQLGKSFQRAKRTMDRKMGDPDFTPCPQHKGKLCSSPCGLCIFYTIKTKKENNQEQTIPEIASEVIISKPPKKRYGLNQETVTKLRKNLSQIKTIGPELKKAIEDACTVDVEDDDDKPKKVEAQFRISRRKRFVTPPRDQASSTDEDIPDTPADYIKAMNGTKTKSSLKKSLMEKKLKSRITWHPTTKSPAKSPTVKSPSSSVEIINVEEFSENVNKTRSSPRLQLKNDKASTKCTYSDAKVGRNTIQRSTNINVKKDKRTSMDDTPSTLKPKVNVSSKRDTLDKNIQKSLVPIGSTKQGKFNTSKSKRSPPIYLDQFALKSPSKLRSGFVRSPPFINPVETLTRNEIDIMGLNAVEEEMRMKTNAVLDSIGQDYKTTKSKEMQESSSSLITPTRLRVRPGRTIAEELLDKINNLCDEENVSPGNKSRTKDKGSNENTSKKVSQETKSTRKDKKNKEENASTYSKKINAGNEQEIIQQKVIETRSRAKMLEKNTPMSGKKGTSNDDINNTPTPGIKRTSNDDRNTTRTPGSKRTSNDDMDSTPTPAKKPKSGNGGKGTKRNPPVKPKKTFQTKHPKDKHRNINNEVDDFDDCEDADEYNPQEEDEEEYVIPDKKRRKMLYYSEPKTAAEKKIREPVTCDICKKRFVNKDNLNRHSKAVHEVRKFICPKCPKTYSRKNTLRQHIRIRHEGYRYICTEKDCGEQFLRKEQLNYHILAHQGEFRYVCAVCGKGYQHRANFEQHENTHLGKKVLKCGKCDKYATNYNGDLTRHVKTCGVKPYIPCSFKGCSEKFTCQEYLRSHLNRTHKQGDPIICRVCGRQFYHTSSISAHMKSHENE